MCEVMLSVDCAIYLPMVDINVDVNASSEKRNSMQVFPTPESPISRSLKSKSYVFFAISRYGTRTTHAHTHKRTHLHAHAQTRSLTTHTHTHSGTCTHRFFIEQSTYIECRIQQQLCRLLFAFGMVSI